MLVMSLINSVTLLPMQLIKWYWINTPDVELWCWISMYYQSSWSTPKWKEILFFNPHLTLLSCQYFKYFYFMSKYIYAKSKIVFQTDRSLFYFLLPHSWLPWFLSFLLRCKLLQARPVFSLFICLFICFGSPWPKPVLATQ